MRKSVLKWAAIALVAVFGIMLAQPALAASCHNTGSYEAGSHNSRRTP